RIRTVLPHYAGHALTLLRAKSRFETVSCARRGALRCMESRSNSNSSRSAGRPTMHGKPFEFEQLALRGAPSDAWKAVRIRTVSHAPGGAPGDTPTNRAARRHETPKARPMLAASRDHQKTRCPR